MRLLFLGDVVGKPGRRAVAALLPDLRRELAVDLVIANTENAAHGKGLTSSTWAELRQAGVDVSTGGNHTFSKPEAAVVHGQSDEPLVRPLNLAGAPGQGEKTFQVGQKSVTVVNLLGQFGMNLPDVENPFITIQRWWQEHRPANVIIVDVHAEATSEKINLGWYLDGKVTAVIGTHTHVATADARVLPNGTGYITDVGMVGLRDSSLGVDKDLALQRFLTGQAAPNEIPETGLVGFNAVLFESTGDGHCATFERLYREYTVT